MSRYQRLIEIVRDEKPRHIIEIGTWNGKRACELMAVSNCYYTGFDLFEEATDDTDEREFNVKAHHELVEVAKRIKMAGLSKFALYRGDTNDTLPQFFAGNFPPFDFCFLDGGHSVKTIQSDYEWIASNISEGGTIILDDWYSPEIVGMGCNFLEDNGEVMEGRDPVAGGGHVSLLRIDV